MTGIQPTNLNVTGGGGSTVNVMVGAAVFSYSVIPGQKIRIAANPSEEAGWGVGIAGSPLVSAIGYPHKIDDGSAAFRPDICHYDSAALNPNLPVGALCAAFYVFPEIPLQDNVDPSLPPYLSASQWRHVFANSFFIGEGKEVEVPSDANFLVLGMNCWYEAYQDNVGSISISTDLV